MDFPLLVLAITISTYWATVILFVLFRRVLHGESAGVIPRQRFERRLWRVLVPLVGLWLTLPWLAVALTVPGLALPDWASELPLFFGVRVVAAGVAVLCYLASMVCWLRMGRSWTMAIVPKQDAQLVTGGPYRWVRHPIYALSMMLMVATAVVLPSVPAILLAVVHALVLHLKARHEESHLRQRFGPAYVEYCDQVGRFCPRVSSLVRRAG